MFRLRGIEILIVVLGTILLASAGYLVPAFLVGLFGVMLLLTRDISGFSGVDVPPAGGYPKFDEWKNLLKDAAEFLGGQTSSLLHTEVPVSRWSDFVAEKIYEVKSDGKEIIPPPWMGLVAKKGYGKDMTEHSIKRAKKDVVLSEIEQLNKLSEVLLKVYKESDEKTRKEVKEVMKKLSEKQKKLLEELKEEEKDKKD